MREIKCTREEYPLGLREKSRPTDTLISLSSTSARISQNTCFPNKTQANFGRDGSVIIKTNRYCRYASIGIGTISLNNIFANYTKILSILEILVHFARINLQISLWKNKVNATKNANGKLGRTSIHVVSMIQIFKISTFKITFTSLAVKKLNSDNLKMNFSVRMSLWFFSEIEISKTKS